VLDVARSVAHPPAPTGAVGTCPWILDVATRGRRHPAGDARVDEKAASLASRAARGRRGKQGNGHADHEEGTPPQSQADTKRPRGQEREQELVGVLEQHPPAKALREVGAEAAAVLDHEAAGERLRRERRPHERHEQPTEGGRPGGTRRNPGREQEPKARERLERRKAELRDRDQAPKQVVGRQRLSELVETRKLARGHSSQEQPVEESGGERTPHGGCADPHA
jgi:hypothetical protein